MKQLARRAWLVVLLLLLTSIGTASAECAWVLWESQVLVSSGEAQPERITAVRAFQAQDACEKHLHGELAQKQAVGAVVTGQGYLAKVGDKAMVGASLVCLPDTIDPRGPKGR